LEVITHGLPLSDEEADVWPTQANEGGAGHVLTTNKDVHMLVLSRRVDEVICIGDDIEVLVIRVGPTSVRIGITAPRHINIARKELRVEPAEDSDCD
jgi:carbon storage regulator